MYSPKAFNVVTYYQLCLIQCKLINLWLQVLGLFTVVATATGCLYFLDQDNIASSVGLNATGVLLLILNFGFVLLMAVLISLRGGPTVLKWARCAQQHSVRWVQHIPGMPCWTRANPTVSAASSFGSSRSSSSSVQLGLLSRAFTRSDRTLSGSIGSGQAGAVGAS